MSDEYCDVDLDGATDDGEPVEDLEKVHTTSVDEQKCTQCGGVIPAGVAHMRLTYRFDGVDNDERVCSPCVEVAKEFSYHGLGGGLWEAMDEEWGNGARVQGCINRVTTVAAKALILSKWQDWKERTKG